MVNISYCDRCKREIQRKQKSDNNDLDIFNNDSWFKNAFNMNDSINLLMFHLCKDCLIGYNKIIEKTNKEIISYLEECNKKPEEKKGWSPFG